MEARCITLQGHEGVYDSPRHKPMLVLRPLNLSILSSLLLRCQTSSILSVKCFDGLWLVVLACIGYGTCSLAWYRVCSLILSGVHTQTIDTSPVAHFALFSNMTEDFFLTGWWACRASGMQERFRWQRINGS